MIYPDVPMIPNNAYLVDDTHLHPGDSFTPPSGQVEVLFVPTAAPWLKIAEAIDYLRVDPAPPQQSVWSADEPAQWHDGGTRQGGLGGTAASFLVTEATSGGVTVLRGKLTPPPSFSIAQSGVIESSPGAGGWLELFSSGQPSQRFCADV